MPADTVVDAVLQQDGPVHRVCLVQGDVTAVCLCHAANLQHEHDLTVKGREGEIQADIMGWQSCRHLQADAQSISEL